MSINRLGVFFRLLFLAAFLHFCESASAQESDQESSDLKLKVADKPGFYIGLPFVGYQGRGIASNFSTIDYRVSATGMKLSYISRFWGLNLNAGRALAFREWIFKSDAVVLMNWAEAGVSIPLLRRWGRKGFFGKCAILLTANTSLFERLYMQPQGTAGFASSQYVHDSFPQIYDFGLELRRNLLNFKLGYISQLRKYSARRPEFSRAPVDLPGAYFEIEAGLGFWLKRTETRVIRPKKEKRPSGPVAEKPPELRAKIQFTEPSGNQKLDGGENGVISIELKNEGKGPATGVQVRIRELYQKNEHLTFATNVKVQELAAENSTSLGIPLTANREIQNDKIELEIEIAGRNFEPIIQKLKFETLEYDPTDDPRRTDMENSDAIAVVIGIRNYQKAQIPTVEYAARDAEVMRDYLVKTLGYKPSNILPKDLSEPMTAGVMKTLIRNELPDYIRAGASDVFVYYAGHGAPNTNTNETFLVPYDCDPNYVTPDNAYRLSDLYYDLANLKARHITLALDACFSGYSGDGTSIIKNVSPIQIKANNPLLSHPNVSIFASSEVDQVSNWYPEKKHGLFTYFFLRGLRGKADANSDRRITVGEMKNYLNDPRTGVPYWSKREFQRLQDPVVHSSDIERVMVDYGSGEK